MKTKIIFPLVFLFVLSIGITSCGGPSVCECKSQMSEYERELEQAAGDEEKIKNIEAEYKKKMEKCSKLKEGKTEDELKAMKEEAENCK
jgi:hypothetical protein